MIIGMCGLKGSGKNTVANIIQKNYPNWEAMSFASALKDGVAAFFGMDRKMLEGDTPEFREIREMPNEFWCKKLGRTDLTPRKILQEFGTDIIRKQFHDNFWVDRLELDLMNKKDKNIIITDVRFPNEIKMIRSLGGQIWFVHCGELPKWFVDYREHNITPPKEIHESEWRWAQANPEVTIHPQVKGLELLEKLVLEKCKEQHIR